MNYTDIQWTWATDPTTGALIPRSGWTWNPLLGCRKASAGCKNCYAERLIATRLSKHRVYRGLAVMKDSGPQFTGEHRLIADRLDEPLRKRNQRGGKTFVNDLGDLFYEGHSNEEIAAVFGVMAAAQWHTFQVVTKRAKRMAEWFGWLQAAAGTIAAYNRTSQSDELLALIAGHASERVSGGGTPQGGPIRLGKAWPLPNVWLGTSTEDQATADERIPWLLRCPARIRFLSVEPQIEAISFRLPRTWGRMSTGAWGCDACCNGDRCDDGTHVARSRCQVCGGSGVVDMIDWIIDGGESGPRARHFDLAWTRSNQAQCKAAGVAYFRKQLGASPVDHGLPLRLSDAHGGDETEWPKDLQGCRAFPVTS